MKENKRKMVQRFVWLTLFIAAVALFGCQMKVEKPATPPATPSSIAVDVKTLLAEQAKSKDEVYNKYNGKLVTLKGKVSDIHPSMGEKKEFAIVEDPDAESLDAIRSVTCIVDKQRTDSFSSIKPKDEVTVRGYLFLGYPYDLAIRDCQKDSPETAAKQGGQLPGILDADEIRRDYAKSKDETYAKYNGKEVTVKGYTAGNDFMSEPIPDQDSDFKLGKSHDGELENAPLISCDIDNRQFKNFSNVKLSENITVKGVFLVGDQYKELRIKNCQLTENK